MATDVLMTWARQIAVDIFQADGGVDDWDTMHEAEIRQIVLRELPNYLAELVTTCTLDLQRNP